jgi:hypothetical protein
MTVILFFLFFCSVLGRWGLVRDRGVWTILALSAVVNLSYAPYVVDGSWLIFIAAFAEFATIKALQLFAWNRLGKRQSLILGALWLAHLCLYFDVNWGSSLVYDRYESVTHILIAMQLAFGTDGIIYLAERTHSRVRSLFGFRGDGVEPV